MTGTESGAWNYVACWIEAERKELREYLSRPTVRFQGFALAGTNGDGGAGTSGFNIRVADWRPIIASSKYTDPVAMGFDDGKLNGNPDWVVIPNNNVGGIRDVLWDKDAETLKSQPMQLTGVNASDQLRPQNVASVVTMDESSDNQAATMDEVEESE